jgi:isopenicillin-N N-acyltransferase like protein
MNKVLKFLIYVFISVGVLLGALFIYLYCVAIDHPPTPKNTTALQTKIEKVSDNFYKTGNNWLKKSKSGLWEMYVEGEAFERGVINGKLSATLINVQEEAFSEQINKLVPSEFYRHFLKYFIAWFNRDLDDNVSEEYKLEIYGVSQSASHKFDYIGSAYQRMLNYHAAHDIGHALQNLALVGCSSFATWNDKSADSILIVGRNFDFYVGDRFAQNKIVLFVNPDKGYQYMMITWGGMTGVVSGMNMEGLTVTLNAAKSDVPTGSATPVSLLAKEILQYAKNIDEAVQIASSRKTFVSESFLIASANDNKAVSIEITPDTLAVFESGQNEIICTNHYESKLLGNTKLNTEHRQQSASGYRFERMKELVDATQANTPSTTASILRNQLGLQNKFIGYGNEKAVNQLICHHSVIFEPQQKIVWVSTNSWQLGPYVAYRLTDIFAIKNHITNVEIIDTALTIPADTFLLTQEYNKFIDFRKIKNQLSEDKNVDVEKLIALNPEYYDAYILAADYYYKKGNFPDALNLYEKALTKEIANNSEKNHAIEMINNCRNKIN